MKCLHTFLLILCLLISPVGISDDNQEMARRLRKPRARYIKDHCGRFLKVLVSKDGLGAAAILGTVALGGLAVYKPIRISLFWRTLEHRNEDQINPKHFAWMLDHTERSIMSYTFKKYFVRDFLKRVSTRQREFGRALIDQLDEILASGKLRRIGNSHRIIEALSFLPEGQDEFVDRLRELALKQHFSKGHSTRELVQRDAMMTLVKLNALTEDDMVRLGRAAPWEPYGLVTRWEKPLFSLKRSLLVRLLDERLAWYREVHLDENEELLFAKLFMKELAKDDFAGIPRNTLRALKSLVVANAIKTKTTPSINYWSSFLQLIEKVGVSKKELKGLQTIPDETLQVVLKKLSRAH